MKVIHGLCSQFRQEYREAKKNHESVSSFRYLASKRNEAFPNFGSKIWHKTCQIAKSLIGKADYQLYQKNLKVQVKEINDQLNKKETAECVKVIIKAQLKANDLLIENDYSHKMDDDEIIRKANTQVQELVESLKTDKQQKAVSRILFGD